MNLIQLPKWSILTIALSTITTSLAAESEQVAPVTFNHDGEFRVSIEGELRIVDMKDNVVVTQGEIEVRGNEARFEYTLDTEELVKVTVTGTPVNYQQSSDSEATVTGTSDTLIMYNDETSQQTIVELVGDAFLETPDSTMRCARIVHQTELDLVSGTGPCQGSLSSATN